MFENDVLALIASTYATCVSYDDKGFVATKHSTGIENKILGRFYTSFRRDNSFHFEFTEIESGNDFVLNCTDNKTSLRKCNEPVLEVDSLESGIYSLYGVTCGVAFLVPTLLLPDLLPTKPRITAIQEAKFQASDNDSFTRIGGILQGNFCELWTIPEHGTIARSITTMTVTKEQQQMMLNYIAENAANKFGILPVAANYSFTHEIIYEQVNIS